MFVRKLILAVVSLVLTAGLAAQELKIAAAADLNPAMPKLQAAFAKQTGVQLKVSFGSSGNFFAEIRNGAPFDVFLSADRSYPETLEQTGKTEEGTAIYARGRLVVWVPNQLGIEPSADNLKILTNPKVKKIAIANPEHAPYGRAAVAAMVHFKVYDQVKSKLVLGENVSQTAQFAQSGNADVAMISLAQALSDTLKSSGHYALVPVDSYPSLDQAAAVIRSSQNKQNAHKFVEFLQSPTAQKILSEYGFETHGLQAKK